MNELVAKFADKLVIIAFPCNQFGHQENGSGEEIYASLKHVRPGGGFEPNFQLMEKCDVNGAKAHELFDFLRNRLQTPSDDSVSFMNNSKNIIWEPVTRTDIAWNFEKFLIAPDGVPFRRYSRYFQTKNIQHDIQQLIDKFKV
ncbi:GPX1-like protein [Mya arenaria]|uniref:Glutathione peroxidase n=3 Tax=Mya arenaria TaxID=6604 RepID=A0ABY7FBH7_MYAAR|nr:GPX1-like protein [Mya arenaria]WAR18583.1 GPX1-like protein [Mya arenaria]